VNLFTSRYRDAYGRVNHAALSSQGGAGHGELSGAEPAEDTSGCCDAFDHHVMDSARGVDAAMSGS
jgi:hypothetical protein